jgi:hypothetical protein
LYYYDTNGDYVITPDELAVSYGYSTSEEVEYYFNYIDTNLDGEITALEYCNYNSDPVINVPDDGTYGYADVQGLLDEQCPYYSDEVKLATIANFAPLDQNKDGTVDNYEFYTVVTFLNPDENLTTAFEEFYELDTNYDGVQLSEACLANSLDLGISLMAQIKRNSIMFKPKTMSFMKTVQLTNFMRKHNVVL